jgi:hypothetical protein
VLTIDGEGGGWDAGGSFSMVSQGHTLQAVPEASNVVSSCFVGSLHKTFIGFWGGIRERERERERFEYIIELASVLMTITVGRWDEVPMKIHNRQITSERK